MHTLAMRAQHRAAGLGYTIERMDGDANSVSEPRRAEEASQGAFDEARLLRLLTSAGVIAFERSGDSDSPLGPATLWAPLSFAPGELPATRAALISRLHPDDAAEATPKVAQVANDDCLLGRLRMRDGSYRRFRQRTRVVPLAGRSSRVVCCLTDVDDSEHADTAARTSGTGEAPPAPCRDDAALGLIARASHEIRTPLNGVLGLVELARRLATSEVQLRHLDMAADSGRALTNVLNGVLDLSSLRHAHETSAPEWVDLDALCADALRSITPQMGWGDFSVVYDFDSDAARVRVDPTRLRQVLVNLLGNAAKVTEHGHIGLSVTVRCLDDERCDVLALVEDTGPGIPADRLPGLFEPFSMASLRTRHRGAGLGLSIVKALVSAMHGSISVSSMVGSGTRFELRFRLQSERDAGNAPHAAAGHGRALLVYAQPFVVGGAWLSKRLQRLGWTAEMVHSVASAKASASRSPPDVLIVAGHSLHSAADLHELASAAPGGRLVLLSRADWDQPRKEQHALEIGARCILVPVSHRDLLSAIGVSRAAGSPTTLPAVARATALPATAELHGQVLLVDDDEINRLVGEHTLASFQLSVVCVESGEAALSACAANPPDAVLMDVQMPGMGGLEACRRIRAGQQQSKLPPFPVIGLTADSTPDALRACEEAGMVLVLNKPYRAEALHRALAAWLTKR